MEGDGAGRGWGGIGTRLLLENGVAWRGGQPGGGAGWAGSVSGGRKAGFRRWMEMESVLSPI